MKPWKPRASALGSYLACPWRAANDRAVYEKRVAKEAIGEWDDGPFGPHGTCIHYVTQVGRGCVYLPKEPTGEEIDDAKEHFGGNVEATAAAFRAGDARAYAPKLTEWAAAATLFKGDTERHRQVVAKVSQVLASSTPTALDGRPWIAESSWETDYCTGHIDLLSQDYQEIEDYKTTAKPPSLAKVSCKPGYYAQMVLYSRFTGARIGRIRHIDSLAGRWTYVLPIDFTTDANRFYSDQLEAFCRFLMSDQLWDVAWPNIGEHCEEMWCPYRVSCKRRIMPPPGEVYNVQQALRPSGFVRPGMAMAS